MSEEEKPSIIITPEHDYTAALLDGTRLLADMGNDPIHLTGENADAVRILRHPAVADAWLHANRLYGSAAVAVGRLGDPAFQPPYPTPEGPITVLLFGVADPLGVAVFVDSPERLAMTLSRALDSEILTGLENQQDGVPVLLAHAGTPRLTRIPNTEEALQQIRSRLLQVEINPESLGSASEIFASVIREQLTQVEEPGASRLRFMLKAFESGELEELLADLPTRRHGLGLFLAEMRSSFVRKLASGLDKHQRRVRYGAAALGKKRPLAVLADRSDLADFIQGFDPGSAGFLRDDPECRVGLPIVGLTRKGLYISAVSIQGLLKQEQ